MLFLWYNEFMRKLLIPLVLLVAGCGGGGGGSIAQESNPMQGTYTGTWTEVPGSTSWGTMTVIVDDNGVVSGTMTDTSSGQSGSVTGLVKDYKWNGMVYFPTPFTISGTINKGENYSKIEWSMNRTVQGVSSDIRAIVKFSN